MGTSKQELPTEFTPKQCSILETEKRLLGRGMPTGWRRLGWLVVDSCTDYVQDSVHRFRRHWSPFLTPEERYKLLAHYDVDSDDRIIHRVGLKGAVASSSEATFS